MTAKNVTNNHDAPLGLPAGGPLIGPGRTARVERWEVVSQNQVVRAWLDAEVLSVSDTGDPADDEAPAPEGNGSQGDAPGGDGNGEQQGNAPVVKTEAELNGMTNAELASYIEKDLGGDVKSNMTKADLVALALDLQD